MTTTRNRFASELYAKKWDPVFSPGRSWNSAGDGFYIDAKRNLNAEGSCLRLFLEEGEELAASCLIQDIEEFCQGVSSGDLASEGSKANRKAAWLDDRSSLSRSRSLGKSREYPKRITAYELQQALSVPRFDHKDPTMLDVDRRLIYVEDIDPQYILALAATASSHQARTLRDAIGQHIAFETSIRIKTILKGHHPVFELNLHLPYYTLSPRPLSHEDTVSLQRNPSRRKCIDLEFLHIPLLNDKEDGKRYVLSKRRISLAICGVDNARWVAYALVDSDSDVDEDDEQDIIVPETVTEDPIASNGRDVINANDPINDPRQYFLKVLEYRALKVLGEWRCVIGTMERSVQRYRDQYFLASSRDFKTVKDRGDDIRRTAAWTEQTMKVLAELLESLSETIEAWDQFKAHDGDVDYFRDIDTFPLTEKCQIHLSLRIIMDTFQDLKCLEKRLNNLKAKVKESHDRWFDILRLHLSLEANETACNTLQSTHETNKTAHTTLSMALQSTDFARRTFELAFASNETARHTVTSTKFTIQFLSPFMLAAAYFSMDRSAVPFKISAISFSIFTIVIYLLVIAVFGGHISWLWRRVRGKSGIEAPILPTS